MEKTHDQAWEEFQRSVSYSVMLNQLVHLLTVACVPEPNSTAELMIKAPFIQGYIYRGL